MTLLARLQDRFFAPAPGERLATLRVLTGAFAVVYMLARANVLADFRGFAARDFTPVGLVWFLAGPLPPGLVFALYALTLAAGVLFTLGLRFAVSGPLFALLFLVVTSYRNSWGMLFHTDNLLCLQLVVLGVADSGAALSRRSRSSMNTVPPDAARFGWPIRLLCVLTTLAYALAGLAKLKASGWSWAEGEILRNYIAYDAVRKAQVGSIYSPLGGWLVQYAWPFPIVGVLTLVLELGGPLSLLHRRATQLWVLGIWGFHVGVLATMAIAFPFPLSGVAFACFFECERLWRGSRLSRLRDWLSGATSASRLSPTQ